MQFAMHCYLNVAAPNMRCGITLLHVMSGVGSMLVAMQGAGHRMPDM